MITSDKYPSSMAVHPPRVAAAHAKCKLWCCVEMLGWTDMRNKGAGGYTQLMQWYCGGTIQLHSCRTALQASTLPAPSTLAAKPSLQVVFLVSWACTFATYRPAPLRQADMQLAITCQ